MPNWLVIILVVAVIGGIIGFIGGAIDDKEGSAVEGAVAGCLGGGGGCAILLFYILLYGTMFYLVIKLFLWIFE